MGLIGDAEKGKKIERVRKSLVHRRGCPCR
jgi:hypothetical protein